MSTVEAHRFHDELASWWPLIAPVEDYAEEAAFLAGLLRSGTIPVRDVLELAAGAGHHAHHLAPWFRLTLVDRSEAMLEQSRRLNPGCAHVRGDGRDVRLGHRFDAVLVHDAADDCTCDDDLGAVVATAWEHLRPGGVAVFVPDHTLETFAPGTDHGGSDGADGRSVRFLEWGRDPDPTDTWVETDYAFVLREPDGTIRTVHETHRTGCFQRARWLSRLTAAGFEARRVVEETSVDRRGRDVFVGRRPW